MTLVSQTDLRNWVPKLLANMKIGKVLSEYVRTIERTAQQLAQTGEMSALMQQAGFASERAPEAPQEAREGAAGAPAGAAKDEL